MTGGRLPSVPHPSARPSTEARPQVKAEIHEDTRAQESDPANGVVSLSGAKHLGELGSVGITLVVATVVGFAGGYWLDRCLGTAPWLAMIGLGFGIAAGFVNLFRSGRRH
jgi:ATP synthase protein I